MLSWEGVYNKLSTIGHPTLLLTGVEDVITPPGNSFMIAEKIPGSWMVQIREAGHRLMYQYSEKISKIIKIFLET
jgi:pimeloyl-ACP methyl ester carboxylesterase